MTDLLVSQVEFASVILLNKCDLVSPEYLINVKNTIRALNAEAKIIESVRSKIDVKEIIGWWHALVMYYTRFSKMHCTRFFEIHSHILPIYFLANFYMHSLILVALLRLHSSTHSRDIN